MQSIRERLKNQNERLQQTLRVVSLSSLPSNEHGWNAFGSANNLLALTKTRSSSYRLAVVVAVVVEVLGSRVVGPELLATIILLMILITLHIFLPLTTTITIYNAFPMCVCLGGARTHKQETSHHGIMDIRKSEKSKSFYILLFNSAKPCKAS